MKVVSPANRIHEAFYALGTLAHIPGGPHHVYFPLRETAARDQFDDIVGLASRMDWIRSVNRGLPPLMQYGLDLRPYASKQDGRSMLAKMQYFCGIYKFTPWFERMESTGTHVVVSRTLVQQNSLFPWKQLLEAIQHHRILFIGSSEEYAAFQPCIPPGVEVDHPAVDWGGVSLDLCLSAALYIGNHSPALAVVEGAHVPAITEVSLSNPDNIYIRENSCPSFTNRAEFPPSFPEIGGLGVLAPDEDTLSAIYADWPTPPHGWRVEVPGRGPRRFPTLDDASFYFCRHSPDVTMVNRAYARRAVLATNFKANPEWASEAVAHRLFRKPALALRAATRKLKLRNFIPPISNYVSSLCD